jgi:hypothetical protein
VRELCAVICALIGTSILLFLTENIAQYIVLIHNRKVDYITRFIAIGVAQGNYVDQTGTLA